MPIRPVPRRRWRSYGDHPLPTGAEALDEPLRAFPSWFLCIVCDRCGKERLISETYLVHGDMLIRDHPRPHAARRLRRPRGEGGTADRRRGRQQPPGAADRAAWSRYGSMMGWIGRPHKHRTTNNKGKRQ